MAKDLSQEELEKIILTMKPNGRKFVTIESKALSAFIIDEYSVLCYPILPRILKSQYPDGYYYCQVGGEKINFSKITPPELILDAINSIEKQKVVPDNVYIDTVVDINAKRQFYQVRIEPREINSFIIKPNNYLKQEIRAYYHTFYIKMGNPNNPNYINILKNQQGITGQVELEVASTDVKKVLSINLPYIKKQLSCHLLTVVLAPRAKANQEEWYQQLRKTVSEWCVEHENEGFVDGCKYIIRHTNTPTTHLKEEGEIYPGITKKTCSFSPEIEGKDILFIDDIYTPYVNVDEDALQAVIDNKPSSITFYSIAKTPKPIK